MRTITHLIAGGIATTALLAGTAATATAQSDKITDKRADVIKYDGFEDEKGEVLNRADSIASGIDATSATVKYTKKSLKVTIRIADVTDRSLLAAAEVRVKGAKKSAGYSIFSISKKKVGVFNSTGTKKYCNGKQSIKSGKKGYVSFTVARSCLKKAKAIKVQVGVVKFKAIDDENVELFEDSISSSTVRKPKSTKWLKAS